MLSLLILTSSSSWIFPFRKTAATSLKDEDTGKVNLEESELFAYLQENTQNAVDDKLIWGSHRHSGIV